MVNTINFLHCNFSFGQEQVEVADDHPQAGKHDSGGAVGVHVLGDGHGRIIPLPYPIQTFGFALHNASPLLLDDFAVIVEWLAMPWKYNVYVQSFDQCQRIEELG